MTADQSLPDSLPLLICISRAGVCCCPNRRYRAYNRRAPEGKRAASRAFMLRKRPMRGAPTEPLITLLTDFGLKDHFAGVLKGVIAGIAPRTRVIDITHEVEPYCVAQARFLLGQSWPYFPQGTVHVAIVDPGVGSERRPILVEAHWPPLRRPRQRPLQRPARRAQSQGAPDLQFQVLSAFGQRNLSRTRRLRTCRSASFAGCRGLAGRPADPRRGQQADRPGRRRTRDGAWSGEIVHVDRFGNLITNLPANCIPTGGRFVLKTASRELRQVAASYSAIEPGEFALVAGSSGLLEIAANQDSAARLLGLGVGARVELWRRVSECGGAPLA